MLKDILWESIEILTIIFGLLGMAVSFLMLFSKELTRKICDTFNQDLNTNRLLPFLDRTIRTDRFFYSHHRLSGIAIVTGSLLLLFLLVRMNVPNFCLICGTGEGIFLISEMLFRSIMIFTLVISVLGVVVGFLLTISADTMIRLDRAMNTWFATEHVVERLDSSYYGVDSIFFRHPMLFGGLGLFASLLLLLLSFFNLFSS